MAEDSSRMRVTRKEGGEESDAPYERKQKEEEERERERQRVERGEAG